MSQNGPYPGQSPQPWSAGGSNEPYQAPSDPWGASTEPGSEAGGWGGNPISAQPGAVSSTTGYTGSGYVPPGQYGTQPVGAQPVGAPPAWPAGPPPRRKGRNTPIVILVVVLGLLTCGGLATTGWLLTQDDKDPKVGVTAAPTATTARPSAGNDVNPGPQSSQDARFVAKGECVRNEGTADQPEMVISPCASGAYEVLARVGGQTTGEADAESKCAKVKGYTKWYFYNSELDELDFVLCLKDR
jgi:hypothetical protein